MKTELLMLVAAIGLSINTARAMTPPVEDGSAISISWLTGNLYLVEDSHFVATNSLVYFGKSQVTVVGATWTPDTARELAAQIRTLTQLPIRQVIDTSPDPEWAGGNAYWKSIGAEIIASRATCDALSGTWSATVSDFQKAQPTYPSLPLVMPTRCLGNAFDLDYGAIRGLYLGPSHTSGDIFVYFPEEKVLDAGSILKPFLGNMAKANRAEYPATLHKLQTLHLDTRMIVAGHWSAVHGPDLVSRYMDLLAHSN